MASSAINVLMSLVDKFSEPMKKIQSVTGMTTKEFKKATNDINKLGGTLTRVGGMATALGVGALGAFGGYAIKSGMDFENSMAKVQAVTNATGEQMERMSKKALELGSKTTISAQQVAEGMKYMGMAGWDDTKINNAIEPMVRLSEATQLGMGEVSDIVTDAMTAFQMGSEETQRFTDVLTTASSSANTDVLTMGEAFKYVGSLAGSMGYSIEDMSVAIGLMANAGVKGSQAGTTLKNAISNMNKPTAQMASVMNELGLSLTDSNGAIKPFSTQMDELRAKFRTLDKAQQAQYASTLFGKESMSGMLAIINASEEDYQKLTEAINNSTGATEEMAKAMTNTLGGKISIFKNKLNSLAITISKSISPHITKALDKVLECFDDLAKRITEGDLKPKIEQLGETIGRVFLMIADVLPIVIPMIVDFISMIVDNIGLITAFFVGFGGFKILADVVATFKQLASLWKILYAIGGAVFPKLILLVKGLFGAIMAHPIITVITLIVGALIYLYSECEWFRDAVDAVFEAIVTAVMWCVDLWMSALNRVIGFITGVFTADWASAFENVKNIFLNIFSGIKDYFTSFVSGISDGIKNLKNKALDLVGLNNQVGTTPHHATGTSYFKGGRTFVNENNRGELINLPNGSQIIPHDLSVKALGGGQKIEINVNVQGNVIGNDDFYNECGRAITSKLGLALANM